MPSWFSRKNKTTKNNKNQAIREKIKKEARAMRIAAAEREADYAYRTIPEVLKNENASYALKKDVLKKYPVSKIGTYYSLPLLQYKVLEEELKELREKNRQSEAEQKRRENEEEVKYIACLQKGNTNCRKHTSSDPGNINSRPGSPSGGTRKRNVRRSRKH